MAFSTSSPAVIIKGSKVKTFGTNPISYSIPFDPNPITADFSTSMVSRGTIIDFMKRNERIPFGWAVDKYGQETDHPGSALEGGLHAIGGDIKGGLISLITSIIAGNMLSGVSNHEVTGTRSMNEKPYVYFFISNMIMFMLN